MFREYAIRLLVGIGVVSGGIAVGILVFVMMSVFNHAQSAEPADWLQTRTACTMEAAVEVAEAAETDGNGAAQSVFDAALATAACTRSRTFAVYDIVAVVGEKHVVADSGQEFYLVTYGSEGQYVAFAFPAAGTTSLE